MRTHSLLLQRHLLSRIVAVATLPLSLMACAQAPLDSPTAESAQALVALEQRLKRAEEFSFTVSINETSAQDEEPSVLESHFSFGSGDRMRIESTGRVNGLDAAPGIVSDGNEMTGGRNGADSPFPDFERAVVPGGLRASLTSSLLRWGAHRTLMTLVSGQPPGYFETEGDTLPGDPQAHAAVGNASWGLPETFDGEPVRPLSFSLSHPTASDVEVILWLSIESGLPVRQTLRMRFYGAERITEEVYSNWSFVAMPSTTFLLPE